ncbi:hypothetical protein MNBD_IGNAVI01-820 [hydrothermal vent metagenome]|uniref:Uncharacterized protein n=1 Tax=hydrothermal vent metagenome TaxID=652676 RepID=A0A3B1C6R5_9ZZZZ
MGLVEKFTEWFGEKNQKIIDLNLKNERKLLSKELNELESERNKIREYINRLDLLIDVEEKFVSETEKGGN